MSCMLSVANKPIMLSVIMLDVVLLSVVMMSVVVLCIITSVVVVVLLLVLDPTLLSFKQSKHFSAMFIKLNFSILV